MASCHRFLTVLCALALTASAGASSRWSLLLDGLAQGWLGTLAGDGGSNGRQAADDEALTPGALADRVELLPGWGEIDFPMFSGYIPVDEDAGRALFYVFVQSQRSPATDPLVLWLNGGPGCSSLGGGLLSELGPFFPQLDGKLIENQWSWTREASVLFVESPAFVGFSYSNTSADADVGDARTSADLRVFMLRFLERFPQFAERPFWISGESYGGHYVPNLALEVVRGNQRGSDRPINLAGFLVGNAWTHPPSDNFGAVTFWHSHALISRDTRDELYARCDFSGVGPLLLSAAAAPNASAAGAAHDNRKCQEAVMRSSEEMGAINIYDVYADVCMGGPAAALSRQLRRIMAFSGNGSAPASADPAPPTAFAGPGMLAANLLRDGGGRRAEGISPTATGVGSPAQDPCIDGDVEAYLNRPAVQAALHANVSGRLPGPWTDCTDRVRYSRHDLFSSMLPVWHQLLAPDGGNLRMLVFSGDIDGIVPVTGTRAWLEDLGLSIKHPWRPYHSRTGQVAGYTVEHERGLTFATVRHAGHMCPYTQPERTFWLFRQFVHGKEL